MEVLGFCEMKRGVFLRAGILPGAQTSCTHPCQESGWEGGWGVGFLGNSKMSCESSISMDLLYCLF